MKISFDASKLNKLVEEQKKKSQKQSEGGGNRFVSTSYLQQGNHKVRLFIDPEEEITRKVVLHQTTGKKCLCPDDLNRKNSKNPEWPATVRAMKAEWAEQKLDKLPPCDICKAAKEINSWKSGLGLKYKYLVYCSLYETNKEDKYWKPDADKGNPYLIVGSAKMDNNITQMLENLAADAPEFILEILNPTLGSSMINMNVTGGTQGGVSLSAIPGKRKPAIFTDETVPEWWKPLRECFLTDDFDIAAYEDFAKIADDKLAEHREKLSKGEKVHSNDDDKDDSDSKEGDKLATPETEDAKVEQAKQVAKEDPKPEVKDPELPDNIRKTRMGRSVELPDFVQKAGCWTKYDDGAPVCITCPINLECMTEKSA